MGALESKGLSKLHGIGDAIPNTRHAVKIHGNHRCKISNKRSYQDLMEVLANTGHAMRAGQVAAAAGLSTDKSKIEGLRSKLNRLAERGWLALEGPGLFIVAHPDAEDVSGPVR